MGLRMDVTSLNVFQICVCLKHLGKAVMVVMVVSLVAVANYAVWSNSLVPGIVYGDPGLGLSNPGINDTQHGHGGDLVVGQHVSVVGQALYLVAGIMYAGTVGMLLWCYWTTMTTHPGRVPQKWYPFIEYVRGLEDEGIRNRVLEEYNEVVKSLGDALNAQGGAHPHQHHHTKGPLEVAYMYANRPRWCKKCQHWKPPRTHHCSMRRECVLKMDHYCVWMVNTIGLLNYKSFVLFLSWAFLGCLMSALLLIRPCMTYLNSKSVPPITPLLVSFIAFVFTATFALALVGFLIMHGSLILNNQTTIEAYEKHPLRPWPHDKGSRWDNFMDVFGRDPSRWALPTLTEAEKHSLLDSSLVKGKIPFTYTHASMESGMADGIWLPGGHQRIPVSVEYAT